MSAARAPTRAAFLFIFVTVALDMLAVGIMAPILPKLILQFEGGNMTDAARLTGIFGVVWAAMQFLFSPVLGALSDRFGRRPVILASNFGLGLDYFLMALAPTIGWLFVGRVISGITAASFSTASAYIADVSTPEQRPRRFGMLGAAFGLGFIVGPAIGGFLGSVDLRFPFWAAGILSLLNALYGLFVLPESLPKERRRAFSLSRASSLGSLRLLGSHKELAGLAVAMVLYFLAHEALPSMFVLYTTHRYGFDERQVAWALSGVGLASAIVSGGLVGPIVKRIGERRALLLSLSAGLVGYLVYALAPTGWVFLCGIPLLGLWGLTGPSVQSLLSQRVSGGEQGQLQGTIAALRSLTGIFGPLLFTQVFAFAIEPARSVQVPGAPYFLGAVLLLLSIGVALKVARPVAD